MHSIKVKVGSPSLKLKTIGLSQNVVLVVFGVKAPSTGSFEPTNEVLGTMTTDKPSLEVSLPVQGTEFRHAAIKLAMTTFKGDLGATDVQIVRLQDPAEAPTFVRPVHLSIELKRPSATSPTYLEQSVVLEEDV